MDIYVIFLIVWLLSTPVFLLLWILTWRASRKKQKTAATSIEEITIKLAKARSDKESIRARYAPIASQEEEIARLGAVIGDLNADIVKLQSSYSEKRTVFDRLEQQIAVYDERLSFAELGVYEPHFDFGDSEKYKQRILAVREREKAMMKAKTAAICPTEWTVEGSKAKGQTMINRQIRLTLRAFNNECEAAIANVRWNNVAAMEKRILAAASAINKENTSLNLTLSEGYVALRIEELRLAHEHREQLKAEKEERAEMARAEREEKRLIAEAEAAEREERKYQALLDKARIEAGAEGKESTQRIAELEAALAEAHAAGERARAMAEMTRSGYVYIISNVGSFGDNVVKIGLTRRLDPDDRVRELGDASVPFGFDTHAMIYSDEAPALEAALHREFADRRINMSNLRKEFFRVSLDEVETAVTRLAPMASFFKDREAQEWHETLARRKMELQDMQSKASQELPAEI